MVDYVPWQGVVDLLNERTGGEWSTEILKTNMDETWAIV